MAKIKEQKATDFAEVVFKVMREHYEKKMGDVMKIAAAKPAPRFYVSFENARRFVSLLERGEKIPLRQKNTIAMYEELHRRFVALRRYKRQHGVRRANYTLLEEIINQPAPSFYTDAETLRCLFYWHLRR